MSEDLMQKKNYEYIDIRYNHNNTNYICKTVGHNELTKEYIIEA